MDYTKKQKMAEQLARFRHAMAEGDLRDMLRAFQALDDGGVFAELDEHTGYASPEQVLQESDSSGSARYGGDHFDTRGATFHGPVIGKVVDGGSVRLEE